MKKSNIENIKSIKQIKENIEISFEENVEGTYVVEVNLFNRDFLVNCQTGHDHSYNETYSLTCINESGGNFYDSGLSSYLEDISSDDDCEIMKDIVMELIEACANKELPENTAKRYFEDKEDIELGEMLDNFGTLYPSNTSVCVKQIKNNEDYYCILYFDAGDEPKIENAILCYKIFNTKNEWNEFRNNVFNGEINGSNRHVHYGDFTASKRAYDSIKQAT